MRTLVPLTIFLLGALATFAQDNSNRIVEGDVTILYRNEATGGIQMHSAGLGILFRRGWHKTGLKKQMLDIEFVSLRDPKQKKLANPYFADSKPYFYGKLNFAYILRTGYGMQNVLFGKGEKSGVEVRYNYFGGLSLGITKPVYLDVVIDNPVDSSTKIIDTRRYDPNDPVQQVQENIYGPGPYFSGMDELSAYPGIYGKFSLSFEFSSVQQKITSLEAGVVFDAFMKEIPIMANEENHQLFLNFFVAISWGGKW
jgi:hypothetical protein